MHGTTGPEVSSEGQCQGKLIQLLHIIGMLLIQFVACWIVNKKMCSLYSLSYVYTDIALPQSSLPSSLAYCFPVNYFSGFTSS